MVKRIHPIGVRIPIDLYERVSKTKRPIATFTREAILNWIKVNEPTAKERFNKSLWSYKRKTRPKRAKPSLAVFTTIPEEEYKKLAWIKLVLNKTTSEIVREALELHLST